MRCSAARAGVVALALVPAFASAASAPDKGDTAWMLVSTALVLLMAVPALALFYGGLVRSKNMLSVLMQVFVVFSLVSVLWFAYGYSLAFSAGNAVIGGTGRVFLAGIADPANGTWALASTFSKGVPMYEIVFAVFQATFAAITCCLVVGSLVERIRFSALLVFVVIWFSASYLPIAHMVWYWPGPDAYVAGATPPRSMPGRASSGASARSISPAAPSCTSTRASPASSARGSSASASATAARHCGRTA